MKKTNFLALSFSLALLATATSSCGSSDDDAIGKCNTFINAFCARFIACNPTATMQACVTEATSMVSCAKAVNVSATYDQCISNLGAQACPAKELPASCKEVIKVSQ